MLTLARKTADFLRRQIGDHCHFGIFVSTVYATWKSYSEMDWWVEHYIRFSLYVYTYYKELGGHVDIPTDVVESTTDLTSTGKEKVL